MKERETPGTDAAMQRCACGDYIVEPDFARKLERERDASGEKLAALEKAVMELSYPTIKAECEEILRLSEKANGGPWKAEGNSVWGINHDKICISSPSDAPFIAHARNVSPAMARVVLATIRWFEELGEHRSVAPLEHLANQWEGKP
jgi:hypothetical protein